MHNVLSMIYETQVQHQDLEDLKLAYESVEFNVIHESIDSVILEDSAVESQYASALMVDRLHMVQTEVMVESIMDDIEYDSELTTCNLFESRLSLFSVIPGLTKLDVETIVYAPVTESPQSILEVDISAMAEAALVKAKAAYAAAKAKVASASGKALVHAKALLAKASVALKASVAKVAAIAKAAGAKISAAGGKAVAGGKALGSKAVAAAKSSLASAKAAVATAKANVAASSGKALVAAKSSLAKATVMLKAAEAKLVAAGGKALASGKAALVSGKAALVTKGGAVAAKGALLAKAGLATAAVAATASPVAFALSIGLVGAVAGLGVIVAKRKLQMSIAERTLLGFGKKYKVGAIDAAKSEAAKSDAKIKADTKMDKKAKAKAAIGVLGKFYGDAGGAAVHLIAQETRKEQPKFKSGGIEDLLGHKATSDGLKQMKRDLRMFTSARKTIVTVLNKGNSQAASYFVGQLNKAAKI